MGEISVRGATLVAATVAMGLMAGLFAAYANSVLPGLARTDDRTFVRAMQSINVAILNGWFLLGFIGAMVLTALATVLHLRGDGRPVLPWLVAASVLYGAVLAITFGVNVPLNERLDAAGDPDRITDLAAVRERFEAAWVRWNLVRALASTAAFGCLATALIISGRVGGGTGYEGMAPAPWGQGW